MRAFGCIASAGRGRRADKDPPTRECRPSISEFPPPSAQQHATGGEFFLFFFVAMETKIMRARDDELRESSSSTHTLAARVDLAGLHVHFLIF